jgi:Cu+-exporting ATPase
MQLIVVSSDLQRFQHVFPQPDGRPGEYAIDLTLPAAGRYLLFDEFATSTGQDVVLRDTVTAAGVIGRTAHLVPDTGVRLVHGMRVELEGAGALTWGRPSRLTFLVTDPTSGLPLQLYPGAATHVAIVSDDGSWFLHTYGMTPGSGAMTMPMGSMPMSPANNAGPRIEFDPTFPGPGLYKIWGELEAVDRTVVTVDFVVEVH